MRLSVVERASLLDNTEEKVLTFVVNQMRSRELVPLSLIKARFGFTDKEAIAITDRLYRLRLVSRELVLGEHSYRPTFSGVDALAIRDLIKRKVIREISTVIGEGKESAVYLGYTPEGDPAAIKFLRIGRSSFKNARKLRGLPTRDPWVLVSLESAKNEYETLECVKNNYGYVPKPFGYSYNAVAMEFVEGVKLVNVKELADPKTILDKILATERVAYVECGKAHGDLSEYNVILKGEEPYVIDWPQAKKDEGLLERDVSIILNFFYKRFGIEENFERVMSYVKGET
ncbi:MAG: RIO1 family regulatory kinase/ATPase [Thermoprotei archaeon]